MVDAIQLWHSMYLASCMEFMSNHKGEEIL